MRLGAIAFIAACTLVASPAGAQQPEGDLEPAVQRLLEQRCWDCHGGESQESGLRLDSMTAALRGGDSGEAAIVPGEPDRSYLIKLVTHNDPAQRMPPEDQPLTQQDVAVLRQWISNKPSWQKPQQRLKSQALDHWSLKPVRRPELNSPEVRPTDELIRRRLDAAGLAPSTTADRRTLIRRLYLVMHGLPPTPQQVDAFLADRQEDAWNVLVERVLESPRYGERWGAHWLDLVRFGETHGFETNRERPNAWPYRDWVIGALNDDKPYDEFVAQQLAGDSLGEPVGTGFLVAGPYDLVKGQDPLLRLTQRQDELADMINTTGTAFLGLTLGCARCHNHKFDPVSHTDYYALQAVFAGVQHAERKLAPSAEQSQRLEAAEQKITQLEAQLAPFIRLAASDDAPTTALREPVSARGNVERLAPVEARFVRFTIQQSSAAQPCIDELEIFAGDKNVGLASQGAKASSGGDFEHALHKLAHINDGQYGNARSWIAKQRSGGWVQIELPEVTRIDRIRWARDRQGKYSDRLAVAYRIEAAVESGKWRTIASSADRSPAAGSTNRPPYDFSLQPKRAEQGRRWHAELKRQQAYRDRLRQSTTVYAGTFAAPTEVRRLHRGDPTTPREIVGPGAIAALGPLDVNVKTPEAARRLQLARWIVRPDNPLTARVIVNRLWQFHFGTGIVDTPSDFGDNGAAPTHPLLLDYLADELVAHGWSLKHIHRLILHSETWRQDSRPRDKPRRADGASRLLWRFPPRRLEAEGIRDCMLAVSDMLDDRIGGPGFSGFQVQLENVRHYFPKEKYGPEDWRRMIYMTKVRQEKDSVFGAFDCPDASQVVPKRSRSTTPLQALSLLNSRFVNQQAQLLSKRLEAEGGEQTAQRVARAYVLCYGREAAAEEITAATAFIDDHGLVQLCRALLNSSEFVFIP